MSSIKSVKYSNEPVFIHSDGTIEPYIPRSIITNRDAYSASFDMLFKHICEYHIILVDILAEKTGLDSDEIIQQIQKDKKMNEMINVPTVYSLGLVERKDVEKIIPVDKDVEALTSSMKTMDVEETVTKKRKYVKKINN